MRLPAHTYTFVSLAILLLLGHLASAQEFPLCTTKYFTGTKKVSSTHCYDKDNRWGRARAFNRLGQQIYERDLRRIAGHSSVEFTYYESGAVKTAHYSSAPDGGIQWYRSFTTFSEDGHITSETHDDYDNRPQVHYRLQPGEHLPQNPSVVPPPRKTTVAECAVIYSSEFWFTNHTPHAVVVTATGKYNKSVTFTLSLHPRETLKCGQLILAQQFDDPAKTFDFTVTPLRPGKNKQKLIIIPSEDRLPENTSKETRRYYYEVRRII